MSMRTLSVLLSVISMVVACARSEDPPVSTAASAPRALETTEIDRVVAQRADVGRAVLQNVGYTSTLPAGFQLSPGDVEVPATLPFRAQVEKHALVLDSLRKALDDAQTRKKLAQEKKAEAGMFDQYLAAEQDEQNTIRYLTPYAVGHGKAQARIQEGYKLKNVGGDDEWTGEVCNEKGECGEVDPIVALFLMIGDALFKEFNKEQPFGPNNELTKAFAAIVQFVDRPLGGPNSDLVKIREALLAHDQNGEIARLIRDPVKRPVEVVQDVRDQIISKDDNGEIAKAIRDPIKCTVGHLWGGC